MQFYTVNAMQPIGTSLTTLTLLSLHADSCRLVKYNHKFISQQLATLLNTHICTSNVITRAKITLRTDLAQQDNVEQVAAAYRSRPTFQENTCQPTMSPQARSIKFSLASLLTLFIIHKGKLALLSYTKYIVTGMPVQ